MLMQIRNSPSTNLFRKIPKSIQESSKLAIKNARNVVGAACCSVERILACVVVDVSEFMIFRAIEFLTL